MYIRNDGKGESNITQNGFTAYLLSAVAHRKADYLHAKQRRQARERSEERRVGKECRL